MFLDKAFIKLAALIAFGLYLSSCAFRNNSDIPSEAPPLPPERDAAMIRISESAQSISQSLVALAEVEHASYPKLKGLTLPNPDSSGMYQLASIDWSGPIGPLVRHIAERTHYTLRVLGREPSVPVVVTIAARNTPMGTLLRDLAFQASQRARIVVYPQTRVIELRYLHE